MENNNEKPPVGGEIAAGALMEPITGDAVGGAVAVAERGVSMLAPAYVPDEKVLEEGQDREQG